MGVSCHALLQGLPNPGVEPTSLMSPALAGGFFTTVPPEKPSGWVTNSLDGMGRLSVKVSWKR